MNFFSLILILPFTLYSQKLKTDHPKILILGNSITYHSPSNVLGWKGSWGMAASEASKDYVHLLAKSIKEKDSLITMKTKSVATVYEANFWKFDTDDFFEEKKSRPDIIIIRLGENIPVDSIKKYPLDKSLERLVYYIADGKTDLKVIITTTFWGNKDVDSEIIKCAKKNYWDLVDFSSILKNPNAMALGQFKNEGVARHPSDIGMVEIYERIWKSLSIYIK